MKIYYNVALFVALSVAKVSIKKRRIYEVCGACGTVAHFPPIYKIYIKIYYNFPVSIIKNYSDETMRDYVPQCHNTL